VITSWTAPGMQNLVAIGSGVSASQIHDFTVTLMCFLGVLQKSYSLHPWTVFTQNASKDVVPCKEVPFGGPDDYI